MSSCIALRLPLPGAVVTWFVTAVIGSANTTMTHPSRYINLAIVAHRPDRTARLIPRSALSLAERDQGRPCATAVDLKTALLLGGRE